MQLKKSMRTISHLSQPAICTAPSESELNHLHTYLCSTKYKKACTSLVMADGFMTALVVLPPETPIKRDFGLQTILGIKSSVSWPDSVWKAAEAEVLVILEKRINSICLDLEGNTLDYCPILEGRKIKAPIPIDWCRGFVLAMSHIGHKYLQPILRNPHARHLLTPIVYLGSSDRWHGLRDLSHDDVAYLKKVRDDFPDLIVSLRNFCHGMRYARRMKKAQTMIPENMATILSA